MSIFPRHKTDYFEFMPPGLAYWYYLNSRLILAGLRSKNKVNQIAEGWVTPNLLIYPPESLIKERKMNGRKPTGNGSKPSSGNGKSLPIRWVNHTLTAEDINALEGETANLELLSSHLIQLVGSGLGVSVKYDHIRKSYNCCIYGSDNRNDGQSCGISGFSPDLRDAVLLSLYKFNNCLQGSFDGCSSETAIIQSSRFR